jgi:hypothetical protein
MSAGGKVQLAPEWQRPAACHKFPSASRWCLMCGGWRSVGVAFCNKPGHVSHHLAVCGGFVDDKNDDKNNVLRPEQE